GRVVENLKLAHPGVRRVARARVADRQTVVATRRQAELHAGGEVGQLPVDVDDAPLAGLAADGTVNDFVVIGRAAPAGQRLAVEDRVETTVAVLGEDLVGLGRGDLADEQVAPADLAAVRLKLDLAAGEERSPVGDGLAIDLVAPGPVVVHQGVV